MGAVQIVGKAVGAALFVGGVHFLVRALTGKTPLEHALLLFEKHAPLELTPPSDPVDEASWESFPASDPPAISPRSS